MPESLFTRLVSYSQNPSKRSIENFLTEVLAHLVNTDRAFRETFVELLIPDRRRRRSFKDSTALPQQTLGQGIVDLVLEGSTGKVFVEVKVSAPETETVVNGRQLKQVKKYLSYRAGYVAYLTTRNVPRPNVNSKFFLGHFFLEVLHGRLKRERLTPTGQLLLDFMEENHMNSLEPFTKTDLHNAAQSFNFALKCKSVLEEVARALEPRIRKMFQQPTNMGFMASYFSPTYKSAYSYTRNFSYAHANALSVFLAPWEDEVGFGVSAIVAKNYMHRINRHLKWEECQSELCSCNPLKPGNEPSELADLALRDLRALKTALKNKKALKKA
jgi:hypothetical protein